MACIYCCKRKEDNKVVYVGLTIYTLDFRLNAPPYGHFYLAFEKNSQTYFHKALRKCGKDAFYFEVIEEKQDSDFSNREAMNSWLNEREKYWIAYYDTFNNGYNQTTGGHDFYRRSEENKRVTSETTKRAMSKLNTKEVCNPTKYMTEEEKLKWKKKISLKTREAMSKLDTKFICNPHLHMTEEQKKAWHIKQSISKRQQAKQQWSDPEKRKKLLESRQGRIWVHKNEERHFIKQFELEFYLNLGFSIGHGYTSNNTNVGKIWMNNGIRQCFVEKQDIPSYINNGYKKGRLKRK